MSQPQDKSTLPSAQTPEESRLVQIERPSKVAGGIPSIIATTKTAWAEMGISRGVRTLLKLNQKDGFDCPGCAWPEPDDERSHAEFCENGAKHVADEATTKRVTPGFFQKWSVADLSLQSDHWLGKQGRITHPMILRQGATHYEQITWDDAFKLIAATLNGLDSPDEAIFYTSGRTSNEAAFLYQLFVREYGTNNLPDCSNMCHESSGVALGESLGIGKGSVKLDDLYEAEVIIILGQNPGTNHPRMLTALQKAKANGAIIISINPLPETGLIGFNNPQQLKGMLGMGTALTDIFLQVKIGADMALLQAIEILLLEEEQKNPGSVFDQSFIEKSTTGYQQFIRHLKTLNLDHLIQHTGIHQTQITEAANILKTKNKIIACWAMGLTQHKNAVDTIKEVVNLLLLKGSIGKKGAGTCPVRGHSNVQGDRTMGIYEQPSPSFLD